jgi:WD40 repeat protein
MRLYLSCSNPQFWRVFGVSLLIAALLSGIAPALGQANGSPRPIQADDANRLRVLTLLVHHTVPITEMEFSPQSSAFLTGSLDGSLCIWNVAGSGQTPGALRLCLPEYAPGVTVHQWSPDDRWLALAPGDGTQIHLFDISRPGEPDRWADLTPVLTLPVGETSYLQLDFAQDGQRLLARDLFDTFTLYELDEGTPDADRILLALEGVESTLSPNTEALAIVDLDGNVRLVEAQSGEELALFEADGALHALFSPGGRWLATWGAGQTLLWDMASEVETPAFALPLETPPDRVQFTPAGRFLATWEGQDIRLWNVETGVVTGVMDTHRGGVRLLEFGAEGQRAVSVNAQGYARLWEISSDGIPRLEWWFDGEIDGLLVSPDSRSLITFRQDIPARFWDFGRGQVRGQYELTSAPVFSPDWTLIAISSGSLVAWHGLTDDPRAFDWMPLGFTTQITNVRPTPSQELQRILGLPALTPIFAFERTEDGQWIHIRLPDNTEGWIQPTTLDLTGDLETLPIYTPPS